MRPVPKGDVALNLAANVETIRVGEFAPVSY